MGDSSLGDGCSGDTALITVFCILLNNNFCRFGRMAEVRSSLGSNVSAASRSRNKDYKKDLTRAPSRNIEDTNLFLWTHWIAKHQ